MAKTKQEILESFVAEDIKKNSDFVEFCKNPLPEYITDNIASDKKLREYQERAVKTFIWYWQTNPDKAKWLLFNMATGTGKTLVMACCILFLYTQGYKKFIFFVSSTQIRDQAVQGFTNKFFKKYLFAKSIRIPDENGVEQNVQVKNFSKNF